MESDRGAALKPRPEGRGGFTTLHQIFQHLFLDNQENVVNGYLRYALVIFPKWTNGKSP
jgi:hypothetical protein